MAMNPEKQRFTLQEYLDLLEKSDQRMEYEHGEIFVMSGGSADHADISQNMLMALKKALGGKSPCRAYMDNRVVKMADEIIFMPDVVVTCTETDYGRGVFLLKCPRVVVEVLSHSTQKRDKTYKLGIYQANQYIEEIVFISQYIKLVEVISRTTEGWETKTYSAGQIAVLPNLNISISVADIYDELDIPAVSKIKEEQAAYNVDVEQEGYYLRANDSQKLAGAVPGD